MTEPDALFASNWFPVVTLILGFVLASISELIRDRMSSARERESRRELRRDNSLLRRTDFQRQTLLELQEATSHLARMTGASHHQDVMFFKKSNKWQKQMLPDEIDEGFRHAQTKVALLHVRVRDSEVRQLSEKLKTFCVEAVLADNETVAENSMLAMSGVLGELNQRIGITLRTLDDDEDRIIADSKT